MKTLLLVASHSGFDLTRTGLGGPAALSDCLIEACRTRPDLKTSVLSSSLLGSGAPESGDFLGYKPSQFIAFFKSFNRAVAQEILRYDPREVVILSNDSLSFRTLSEKGYSIYCLHHMNYVDFFANVFLRDVLKSETLAGIHKLLMNSSARVLVPEAIDLIFRYQEESVVNVRGAIVPSAGLKRRFLQLYPKQPVNQIHVVPWGSLREAVDDGLVADRMFQLREEYRISCNTFVVLMLSRISPEKGQDRVIRALKIWENDPNFPTSDICLLICGICAWHRETGALSSRGSVRLSVKV
jgi:glycosyltransferase involved in cell wall biosynthesis